MYPMTHTHTHTHTHVSDVRRDTAFNQDIGGSRDEHVAQVLRRHHLRSGPQQIGLAPDLSRHGRRITTTDVRLVVVSVSIWCRSVHLPGLRTTVEATQCAWGMYQHKDPVYVYEHR
jgi:hypothetical protein